MFARAAEIAAEARAGADFAALAREHSQGPSAPTGGDLGWFPQGGYGTKVAEVVVTLKDGEISAPFKTDAGWHVMQLLETRTEDKTAEAERNKARQTIGTRKAEEEYASFLRQLRAEAYIEIRLPGADGASGNAG